MVGILSYRKAEVVSPCNACGFPSNTFFERRGYGVTLILHILHLRPQGLSYFRRVPFQKKKKRNPAAYKWARHKMNKINRTPYLRLCRLICRYIYILFFANVSPLFGSLLGFVSSVPSQHIAPYIFAARAQAAAVVHMKGPLVGGCKLRTGHRV